MTRKNVDARLRRMGMDPEPLTETLRRLFRALARELTDAEVERLAEVAQASATRPIPTAPGSRTLH